jgi:hypothetical protein
MGYAIVYRSSFRCTLREMLLELFLVFGERIIYSGSGL